MLVRKVKITLRRITSCTCVALALATAPALANPANKTNTQITSPVDLVSTNLPLPGKPSVSEAAKQARLRWLGTAELNPNVVQLWWVGVSSFVMNLGGHLVLLDAWEVVGFHKNYVPIDKESLASLEPEAVLIGHGHFDHAGDAGYIAGRSGAAIVAGTSVCEQAKKQAREAGLGPDFTCIGLGNKTHPKTGSVYSFQLFDNLPPITIIKHTHSAASLKDWLSGGQAQTYAPNLSVFWTYRNTDLSSFGRFLMSMALDGGLGEPDGGTWAYWFKVGEFDLFWHDSSGRMAWGLDDTRAVFRAIRDQGCADVQLAAIVGFGLLTSGYRDTLAYVNAARPQILLPTHHDAWFPVIGGGALAYEASWTQALKAASPHTEQDYLRDPQDYLKTRTYDTRDKRWQHCGPALSP